MRVMKRASDVDFVGRRRLWYRVSGGLVVVSLLALIFLGLNLSIDFTGGTLISFQLGSQKVSEEEAKEA